MMFVLLFFFYLDFLEKQD